MFGEKHILSPKISPRHRAQSFDNDSPRSQKNDLNLQLRQNSLLQTFSHVGASEKIKVNEDMIEPFDHVSDYANTTYKFPKTDKFKLDLLKFEHTMGNEFTDNQSMKDVNEKFDDNDDIYAPTKPRSILGKRTMSAKSKNKSKKIFSSSEHHNSTPIYCQTEK